MTGQALGIGVELLAASQALRRQGGRRGQGDGLDHTPLPEAAVQALGILEDVEPLRDGHMLEARHDAVAAQADGHRAAAAAHALRQGPEQIGGRRELTRGCGAELELCAGEVTGLRSPPRGEHGPHGAVARARDAVAWDARHDKDVAAHRDALWVLPGNVRPVMSGVRVLIRHHGPSVLDRELALPWGHGRALALERLDLSPLAHAPEPVVVAHLPDAVLVAEVGGFEG